MGEAVDGMLPHVGALIGSRCRRIAYGAAMIVRTWAGRGRRPRRPSGASSPAFHLEAYRQ
jgi:hypothetical protein